MLSVPIEHTMLDADRTAIGNTDQIPPRIWDLSAHLSAELAAQLEDRDEILRRYEVSDDVYEVLRKHPVFRKMVQQALIDFKSMNNAEKRIQLKAAIAAEDSVAVLDVMVHNPKTPQGIRLDAIKILHQIAGSLDPTRREATRQQAKLGPVGQSFNLQINLGNGLEPININDMHPTLEIETDAA